MRNSHAEYDTIHSVADRKLLGHLAQFGSFSMQAELLCTQGLAFLLRNSDARRTFAAFLSAEAGTSVDKSLGWMAETRQSDGRRPDLEGCRDDGRPTVKIEAKLDARFGEGQLAAYLDELRSHGIPRGVLLVLVPRNRRAEAIDHAMREFGLSGEGPWRLVDGSSVGLAVVTWEAAFEALGTVSAEGFRGELGQLRSMYRVLNGDDMEPLSSDEQVLRWRDRERWWVKLVDLGTRRLAPVGDRLLPMGFEQNPVPYTRRYICRRIGGLHSCYSVGTRDPFENHRTPIWLRFHGDTVMFSEIAHELERSSLSGQVVRSSGHLWYPLEVPPDADRETMVSSLATQATQVVNAAYRFIGEPLPAGE